jgi:hypothetical protein
MVSHVAFLPGSNGLTNNSISIEKPQIKSIDSIIEKKKIMSRGEKITPIKNIILTIHKSS